MTSRQPRSGTVTSSTGSNSNGSQSRRVESESPTSLEVPRPKRIACVVCRKRKLRCDGLRPSCATCSRLGHECAYDEVRRKSGPKRGYVKALEARLAQVETLLKDQNGSEHPPPGRGTLHNLATNGHSLFESSDHMMDGIGMPKFVPESPNMSWAGNIDPSLSWEMVAMGMEESLPSIETVDALHTIYFEKIHPSIPIIHRGRYFASLDMAPNLRPSIALRYAMWTLAASVSEQYANMQTHYYHLSRKYLEDAEMKGHGEGVISMCTCQAWSLISTYEFKLMYFPRAWLSTGRATRLAQMMGLHRLDGQGLEVKQCLPVPKDWIEKEERRRTFWHIFCVDRYASMGTGWPMTIEERDILTNLPVTDDAFDRGRTSKGMSLKEAMTAEGAAMISPFGGVCLMASMFGRNLTHLHRPDADDKDDSLNGEFWRRHRQMDNILLNIALSLPSHFRLPAGINDSSIVFTNMNIHTSTICLHQAAIFKADKNRMPSTVSAESKIRCITAAAEIASIMRMVCHLDLSGMNPFISFCLYVAARVFVQYLKSRPGDEQVRASLQFLLTAMGHMKKKNPLTESFLVQLDVDLTGSIDNPEILKRFPYTQQKGQVRSSFQVFKLDSKT
ncbi:fungal-specific transcription factor domain-containing protein [Geopyxis carbonaria]|nr:fungal-specific transcription factor domain-containing protein [Geopyxis carbonaria]